MRMSNGSIELDAALERQTARLAEEFAGIFSRETVAQCVQHSLERLVGLPLDWPRVTDYLPLLTYRFARERLLAVAQAERLLGKSKPELLFVCVRNAGRSQLAAALARVLSGGRVHASTAGSSPHDHLDPGVIAALAEVGIDVGEEVPNPLTDQSSAASP